MARIVHPVAKYGSCLLRPGAPIGRTRHGVDGRTCNCRRGLVRNDLDRGGADCLIRQVCDPVAVYGKCAIRLPYAAGEQAARRGEGGAGGAARAGARLGALFGDLFGDCACWGQSAALEPFRLPCTASARSGCLIRQVRALLTFSKLRDACMDSAASRELGVLNSAPHALSTLPAPRPRREECNGEVDTCPVRQPGHLGDGEAEGATAAEGRARESYLEVRTPV